MKAKYEVRYCAGAEFGYVWQVVNIETGEIVHDCRENDKRIADHIAWLKNS